MVAHPLLLAGSGASATEISESPPPVPRSGWRGGLGLNVTVPSGFCTSSTNQKLLPRPVGAEM